MPPDADDATLGRLCQEHTARLDAYLAGGEQERPASAVTRFDGTMYAACRIYQEHPLSRFQKVKRNTRKSYIDSLKIIEATVGARLIKNVTVPDVLHWYDQWRKPALEGGKERIDRASDATAQVKAVLRFCASMRLPFCKQLSEELSLVRFEKGGAREQELNSGMCGAFIAKALELGQTSVIPLARARYMAIGVAAQFELMLRQKDIIGERLPLGTEAPHALHCGQFLWSGYFRWENIPGWRWRMKTSKSKYRAAAEYDLTKYGLLFPLLDSVPHDQRTGAIIKDETLRPVREGSYRKWFRQIARAAGIPDDVWSMDSRAGGATEAEEAGAALDAIQNALTHSKKETTVRYIRRRSAKIADVADARQRKRANDDGSGTS